MKAAPLKLMKAATLKSLSSVIVLGFCMSAQSQTTIKLSQQPATSAAGLNDLMELSTSNAVTGFANGTKSITVGKLFTGSVLTSPNVYDTSVLGAETITGSHSNNAPDYQIIYEGNHSVEPELAINPNGGLELGYGLDASGKGHLQIGPANQYNTTVFINANDQGDLTEPGQSQPFMFKIDNNNGVAQTYHVGGFHLRTTDTNAANEMQWHDHFGTPTTTGGASGGFHQPEFDPVGDHTAMRIGSNYLTQQVGNFTNAVVFGLAQSTAASYAVDWSYAGSEFSVLTPDPAITFANANLAWTNPANAAISNNNVSIHRQIALQGQYDGVAVTWPANWINLSSYGTNTAFPANVPGSNDLVIDLHAFIGVNTNIYATLAWGYNPPVTDPDVAAFVAAAGITGGTNIVALNQLVSTLKVNSIWASLDAIYPFMGTSSTMQKFNLKNPALYNMTWTAGSSTWDVNGYHSDGVSGFGNTGFNPNTASSPNYTPNSAMLYLYSGTPSFSAGSSTWLAGADDGSHKVALGFILGGSPFVFASGVNNNVGAGGGMLFAYATSEGSMAAIRTGSPTENLYASSGTTPASTASTGVPNQNIYIGAENGGGSAAGFTAFNFRLAAIGGGLTSSQFTTFTNAVYAFEQALNRQ